jgi:hypothetical protein
MVDIDLYSHSIYLFSHSSSSRGKINLINRPICRCIYLRRHNIVIIDTAKRKHRWNTNLPDGVVEHGGGQSNTNEFDKASSLQTMAVPGSEQGLKMEVRNRDE